jgi:phage-related protein
MSHSDVTVVWEGDSLEVVQSFPKEVRTELGADIRRLQNDEQPRNSRPMKSVGARVYELRQMDKSGWYRVIYLAKVNNRLHMLHAFVKQSAKTSPRDLRVASQRLKVVLSKLKDG